MRRWTLALAAITLGLVSACEEDTEDTPQQRSSAPSTGASAAPKAAEPPAAPKVYDDLDVQELVTDLGCSKAGSGDVCDIATSFQSAKAWEFNPPSREARYVGYVYDRSQGKVEKDILVMWATLVPTAQVAEDAIPINVGWQPLPDEYERDAEKLIRGVSRGNAVAQHNYSMRFIEEFQPKEKLGVVKTETSTRTVSQPATYIRQASRTKLLLVSPSREHDAVAGDGRYAELYKVDW